MRRLAVVTLALAPVLAIAGCATGTSAATTNQQPSGNGSSATVGALQLRGITIVKAGADLPVGTVIGTIVNTSGEADALTSVSVKSKEGASGPSAAIVGGESVGGILPLPGRTANRASTQFGTAPEGTDPTHIDLTNFIVAPTAFVTLVFTFQKAGTVEVPTMAVPPTGIYTGIGPLAR